MVVVVVMFDRFFDDAAIFPPGNADLAEAVRAHLDRRTTAAAACAGPFVCPADRLEELAGALAGERVEVAAIGVPPDRLPAGIELVAAELIGPTRDLPVLPPGVRVFVEQPWGSGFDVPAGAFVKLRCGGSHTLSAGQLAMAISHCVQSDQPFKLTAGLHHAMRTDHEHGLLNVLAAVDAALGGADPLPMLLIDDPEQIMIDDPAAARRLLLSVGTCSIDESLSELQALGWLP